MNLGINEIKKSIQYSKSDNFFYLALLSAPVLLTIFRYYTQAQNYIDYFPSLSHSDNGEVISYILENFSFFLLVFIVPLSIALLYNKGGEFLSLFKLPNFKTNLFWTLLFIVILIVPMAYNASTLAPVIAEYPLPRSLLKDQNWLFIYFLSYFAFYYVAWEFFFRGFLLFGLKSKYGVVTAILIQTISSCLVHIDKPGAEILGSIPFGIVMGIISIRTKSIWVVILIHAALGILTDLFIIY